MPSPWRSIRSARAESVNVLALSRGILISPLISAAIACDIAAARGLPFGEPARDPLEARPPQRAGLRLLHQRREMLFADTAQHAYGVVRQCICVFLGEFTKRFVDRRAAIGRRQRHVDGIERVELENVAGIDGVGIAQPVLDRGDRELCRTRLARRLGLRLLDRLDLRGLVDRAGVANILVAGRLRRFPALLARDGFQPVQEARGDGRSTADLGRMGEDHVLMAEQLSEVVRRKADAALRKVETEFVTHRPAQPGIDARRRRPHGFDQPAQDDAVGFRQPRFQLAEDVELRARQLPPPHQTVGKGGLEHFGIVAGLDHQADLLLPAEQIVEGGPRARARPAPRMPWRHRARRRRD